MKSMVRVAFVLATLGSVAQAQDRDYDRPPADRAAGDNVKVAWADVLRVDAVYDRVQTSSPREECEDVRVERRSDNGNRAAGTVIGAIVGGVLGNTVGKGDGRKAATVVGAVAGGAVGNNVAKGDEGYYSDTERRCRTVQEAAGDRRIVGYDVQYRYRGDVYMSRLNFDPGERMRVRVSIEPAE